MPQIKLLPSKWRDIDFPLISVHRQGSLNHNVHSRYLINSAFIESMGRAPYVFKLSIPLINNLGALSSDPSAEDWNEANLFPGVYNQLLAAAQDGKSGDFVHPALGPILCKCITDTDEFNASTQGGIILDLELIETLPDDESQSGLPVSSPVQQGQIAAKLIASKIKQLPNPPDLGQLSDLFDSIQALQDSFGLIGQQISGAVNKYASKFERLKNSMDTLGIDPVGQASFALLCELAQDAANRATELATVSKPASFLVTKVQMTIPQAAKLVKTSLSDFYGLNPDYAALVIIPAGSLIKFYR